MPQQPSNPTWREKKGRRKETITAPTYGRKIFNKMVWMTMDVQDK